VRTLSSRHHLPAGNGVLLEQIANQRCQHDIRFSLLQKMLQHCAILFSSTHC